MKKSVDYSKYENTELETKLQQCIGEYIYTFENILESIRFFISCVMKRNGLKKNKLVEIILFDSMAGSLLNYYKGLVFEVCSEEMKKPQVKSFMNKLWNDISKSIEKRNNVAHANWSITFQGEELTTNVLATKNKMLKDGLANVYQSFEKSNMDSIKADSAKNKEISNLISKITFNYYHKTPLIEEVNKQRIIKLN